jgi:uncharacterized protein (TIGR03067 family)
VKACSVLLLAVCLIGAAPPKEDAAKIDVQKLQGTWNTQATIINGEKRWTSLVIQGDQLSWQNNSIKGELGQASQADFTYKLDPTTRPKQIDLTWAKFANKGKVELGIYQLNGDILTLCTSPMGKPRPKDLRGERGSGQSTQTFKRAGNERSE